MLSPKDFSIYNHNKDNLVIELLAIKDRSVIFLNQKLQIIRVNEHTYKRFGLDVNHFNNFIDLVKHHNFNSNFQYAADIADLMLTTISNKLRYNIDSLSNINWRVEVIPGLSLKSFNIALIEILTEKVPSKSNIFCGELVKKVSTVINASKNHNAFTNSLENIVKYLPGRAHVKIGKDFQYAACNDDTLKLLGMANKQSLIGLDDYLLSKHMGARWPKNLADELKHLDYQILNNNTPIIGHEETPYLDYNDKLVIHSLTKIPIFDLHNEPYGILTLAMDVTHLKDLQFVRNAYSQLYRHPKTAHLHFLRQLGLDKLHVSMDELITIRELECLILFSQGKTAKEIAKLTQISHRTVEKHFESIKYKLNCNSKTELISLFLALINQ